MLRENAKWVQCDTVQLIRMKTVAGGGGGRVSGVVFGSFRLQPGCRNETMAAR